MGMVAVGGASGTQITPMKSDCGMAPADSTPPVDPPKAGGPVDTSDAGKGAVAGAAGGGPAVDAVDGASQLSVLQDVLTQLIALIQQLTTLLAGQVGGAKGGGPVQQDDSVQQGEIAGAKGSGPVQQDDSVKQGEIAGAKGGGPVQQEDSVEQDPKSGKGTDVAGASGKSEVPDQVAQTITPEKFGGPVSQSGVGGAFGAPKPVGPTPEQIAAKKKAMAAAQLRVDADKADIKDAQDNIAKFKIDRAADQAKIDALRVTISGKVGQVGQVDQTVSQTDKSDAEAQIAHTQTHLDRLTSGISYNASKIPQYELKLEHSQIALAAVSK